MKETTTVFQFLWCDSSSLEWTNFSKAKGFQFLYGAIGTVNPILFSSLLDLFQFLYVPIDATELQGIWDDIEAFQFLYGAIQTIALTIHAEGWEKFQFLYGSIQSIGAVKVYQK